MREIKFRVYSNGKMIEIQKHSFKTNKSMPYGWNMAYEFESGLMQYTGLKDKNDTEIYEGDILKKQGCWLIKVEYDKGCFMLRDVDSIRYNNLICDSFIYDFPLDEWEVVGNIYENPELLDCEV